MAQIVNTNYASLQAQSQLNKTNNSLETSLQRLSSGIRINSAKDDAAGLAIASAFTAQINGFNQGSRNASDAISLAQTAESALDEMSNNVQRIRELAVQSRNGTNSTGDRSALNLEVTKLSEEIDRIAANTMFNDINIFNNSNGSVTTFQVGANTTSNDTISVGVFKFSGDIILTAVTGAATDIKTSASSDTMVNNADALLDKINALRADLGSTQNRFESVVQSADSSSNNMSESRSRIIDTDFAKETATLTKMQILQQAGISVLTQANTMPQAALSLLGQ